VKTKRMKLTELNPAAYNPRSITESAMRGLTASIERFGCVEPIIWNERTGNVVGGHQRLKVLQSQGEKTTDVVVVDLPEVEEKALNLSLNNPAITGDFTADVTDILAELGELIPDALPELLLDDIGELAGAFDVDGGEYPALASGDRGPFQQMTFTLSDEQAESVKRAMSEAKATPFVDTVNDNSNGNALARIAEAYLG